MLSLIQYRRLGRDVQREHESSIANAAAHQEKRASTTPSPDAQHGSQQRGNTGETASRRESTQSTFWVRSEGDDDPMDPRNWPLTSRSRNIAVLCLLIFVQGWAGGAESMVTSEAAKEFGVSPQAENLATAMYLFGIATGALFAGPLSETVGRNPTYLVSTFIYLLFVLGATLSPNFGGHIVCRYFVGLFSSATLSINGASVRDQFRPVKRAFVFPVIAWANVAGECPGLRADTVLTPGAAPVIAPIAGGWLVSDPRLGWRWTGWVTLIISAFAWSVAVVALPETYLPVLLDWKAKQLRRVTGDGRYRAEHAASSSFFRRMREVLPLPVVFFAKEPVISVLGIYLVLLYALLFSFLSGFEYMFKRTYGLSTALTGSCFGAIALGCTVAALFAPGLYSWARHRTEHVRGAPVDPEFRLWPAMVAAPCLPVCLFVLGWANRPAVSVWLSLAACFVFGVVLISVYVSAYEYIIDSYGEHAAVALSSITLARYLVAGGMVMASRPMYEGIGVAWSLTIMGCFATVLAPAPVLFWRYGARLRDKSKWAKGRAEFRM